MIKCLNLLSIAFIGVSLRIAYKYPWDFGDYFVESGTTVRRTSKAIALLETTVQWKHAVSLGELVQDVQRSFFNGVATENQGLVGLHDLAIGDHLVQNVVGLLDVEHYVQLALR